MNQFLKISIAVSLATLLSVASFVQVAKQWGPRSDQVIKNQIAEKLLDPESAKFSSLQIGEDYACGFVNGKNTFGAYTGRKFFIYDRRDNELAIEPGSEATELEWTLTTMALRFACRDVYEEYEKGL